MSRYTSIVLCAFVLAGCERDEGASQQKQGTVVSVSKPVRDNVTESEDFNGHIAAKESVEVRARVNGYLAKVFFKEGDEVKKGAKLFEIDQRPYKADVDKAAADVERAKAIAKTANYELERQRELVQRSATSKADFDKAVGEAGVSVASIHAAEAALEQAKLNFEYTTIAAEIDGKIGRYEMTPGNLVVANQTLLTRIESVEPMYAYFDLDEQTVVNIKKDIQAGKIKSANDEIVPVEMSIAGDTGYPRKGSINFVDNRLDPNTGTLKVRGVFTNELKNSLRLLTPGMFCRVRVVLGEPHEALLVSERAIGTEQGQKFLLIVDAKNVVEYRPVKVGQAVKGLRVIEEGLKGDERVIVIGQMRVRPGMTVEPKDAPMIAEPERTSASAKK
jgi:RND family efflux transporter MFP subunit